MPKYRVTDPDSGRTLELVGDSPPTEQELEQIFSRLSTPQPAQQTQAQAPVSEPTAQQAAFEGLAREKFAIAPDLPVPSSPLSVIEPAITIASGAVAEPIAGVAGIVQSVNPFAEEGAGARAIEAVREAITIQPKTEEGKAGLQTAGQLLEPVTEAIQAAETTLGDVGFDIAGPIGGAIGKTIPTAILTALGVKRTPGGAPDISPQRVREIESVIAASERTGVDVLTSDLFQPKSVFSRMSQQFQERIPLFGTGGKRANQQQQRVSALEELEASTPRVESADIITSLNESANKARVAAGKRIEAVKVDMDVAGGVDVRNALKRIDLSIESLTKPGKIESPELVTQLENLRQTVVDAGDQGFSTLREFRTDARSIADKVDPTGRSQLRTTDKALMDGVILGVTKDLDNFVLDNTNARGLARYKQADQVYRNEAIKLTKSRLKTVLDKGEVKPELVNNLLFSSSPSEVKLLFKNLDTAGRQNARLSLMRRALDSATRQGDISPARFSSELDKLSNNFNVFFRGDSRAELQGLKKLMETTRRAGESSVITPTGQALQLPATTAAIAGAAIGDPTAIATVLLASTVGLGARAYESAGVRNMLIRLGKATKRSTLEADLKRSIPLLLEQAARVVEQEQQSEQTP